MSAALLNPDEFRTALETQKVCEAVLTSAKEHQWQNV